MSSPIDSLPGNGEVRCDLPLYREQSICIFSFGPLRIQRHNQTITFTGKLPQKPLLLLKMLIACGHMGKAGYILENQLWPFVAHESAKRSLISTTRRLRDLLGDKTALVLQHGKLYMEPTIIWNDTWAFEQTLKATDNDEASVKAALNLYQARFLPDEDAPLIQRCRERLHQNYLSVLQTIAGRACKRGEWQTAIDLYQQALAVDDISEGIYQGLMRCYRTLGQEDKVKQLYARCEKTLQEKLSVSPSTRTRALSVTTAQVIQETPQ